MKGRCQMCGDAGIVQRYRLGKGGTLTMCLPCAARWREHGGRLEEVEKHDAG